LLEGAPGEIEARLAWKTRNESQTYGYVVYRSERPEGPYLRANREIVRTSPGEGPQAYSFVDRSVVAGRTYYYYLEQVSLGGGRIRLPRVVAKRIAVSH
jgi:hypothetical protein